MEKDQYPEKVTVRVFIYFKSLLFQKKARDNFFLVNMEIFSLQRTSPLVILKNTKAADLSCQSFSLDAFCQENEGDEFENRLNS